MGERVAQLLDGTPAWLQGLFREFLYEVDILAYPTWIFSSWSGTVARAG